MIVWLNGPFAAGKTTVAALLRESLPGARRFDPELIGYVLRRVHPGAKRVSDFQHLRAWRTLTLRGVLAASAVSRTLVVPMTLLRADYFDEIVGALRERGRDVRHVCLRASRETVMARAAARGTPDDPWVAQKYDEYEPALRNDRFGPFVDTDSMDAAQVVSATLRLIGPAAGRARRARSTRARR